MRLIDADALGKRVKEFRDDAPYSTVRWYVCNVILSMLGDENQTPTIEAEPVRHGRWETFLDEDWGGNTTYLHGHKKCGYVVRSCLEKGTPYCPNCGAKMDGDNHD